MHMKTVFAPVFACNATAIVLLLAIVPSCGKKCDRTAPYEFILDGEILNPEVITLHGEIDSPRPGDVVVIGDHQLVLGSPGIYRLVQQGEGRLARILDDHTQSLVALRINLLTQESELRNLSDHVWAELRGLEIGPGARISDLGNVLGRVDAAHCIIRIMDLPEDRPFASLPSDLRYLDLQHTRLTSISGVERIKELQYLILPSERNLTSLLPATELTELCYLEIPGTGISDFRSLDCLANLRHLVITCSPVSNLPTRRLPRLERVELVATTCSPEVVRGFRKRQYGTTVLVGFREVLVNRLADAKRIRIRTGSAFASKGEGTTLYDTVSSEEIGELLTLVHLEEEYSPMLVVPAAGNHTIEIVDDNAGLLTYAGL